jgi:hypothetical protein
VPLWETPRQVEQVFLEHLGQVAHARWVLMFLGGIQALQLRAEQYTRSPVGIDHSASRS